MEEFNRKEHWENIYKTKELKDVSWYQPIPKTSLDFLKQFHIPTTAKIIDVGGGDSFLVDHLLNLGYQDITVLDISEQALNKAKLRLGSLSDKVKWIVADASNFTPTEKYDFWHDRAAFHFLTQENDIETYIETVQQSIQPDGILVIGTFSEVGPKKCSGIDIKQYSKKGLTDQFKKYFKKIKCITADHKTPFDSIQNFVFCSFKKIKSA
jgi:ubiquinone/menaquinone biosynthesis C-methylase UbiE